MDKEKSEFISPNAIVDGHLKLMGNDFKNVIDASTLPEIAFGTKMTGNHAAAEKNMIIFLGFVIKKRNQASEPYTMLVNSIMQLEAMANNQIKPENIILTWNDFNTLTKLEKSQVFKNYADAINVLIDKSGIDLQSVHNALCELTENMVTENYDEFEKQIKEYGSIRALLDSDYMVIREVMPVEGDTMAIDTDTNQDKTKSEKEQRNGKKSKTAALSQNKVGEILKEI